MARLHPEATIFHSGVRVHHLSKLRFTQSFFIDFFYWIYIVILYVLSNIVRYNILMFLSHSWYINSLVRPIKKDGRSLVLASQVFVASWSFRLLPSFAVAWSFGATLLGDVLRSASRGVTSGRFPKSWGYP